MTALPGFVPLWRYRNALRPEGLFDLRYRVGLQWRDVAEDASLEQFQYLREHL